MANKVFSSDWNDYELIDSGDGRKLERWGNIITIRPEVQAYFKSESSYEEWKKIAHLEFIQKDSKSGKWEFLKEVSIENWQISYKSLILNLELTKFKHVGIFPEQATNWEFIIETLSPSSKMLNLFAYTGVASIIGKATGADVTHVDSVKQLITWARKNMESSQQKNIRWIHEDALKFAQREVKRENKYDLIIMDPPAWGIGVKNEKWKIEDKLAELISTASKLLNPKGVLILNTYSPKVELEDIKLHSSSFFSRIELSELWKKSTSGKKLFYGHLMRAWK